MPRLFRQPTGPVSLHAVHALAGVQVDREAHVLKNVSIIQAGEALGHSFEVDAVMLRQVADAINAKPKGVKSRLTHPGLADCGGWDGIEVMMGRARNARVEGDKVKGDVVLGQYATMTPAGDIRTYVEQIAAEDPELIGMSIVFEPGEFIERPLSPDAPPDQPAPLPLGRIKSVLAADFVGDPAANRDGLLARLPQTVLSSLPQNMLESWARKLGAVPVTNDDKQLVAIDVPSMGLRVSLAPGAVPQKLPAAGNVPAVSSKDSQAEGSSPTALLRKECSMHFKLMALVALGLLAATATPEQADKLYEGLDAVGKSRIDAKAKELQDKALSDAAKSGAASEAAPSTPAVATAALKSAEDVREEELRKIGKLAGKDEAWVNLHILKGTSPADARKEAVDGLSSQVQPVNINVGAGVDGGTAQASQVTTAALCLAGNLPGVEKQFPSQILELADRQRRDISLQGLLLDAAARRNLHARRITKGNIAEVLSAALPSRAMRLASGFSGGDISGILANTSNKFMVAGFTAVEQAYRRICRIRNVSDFKTVTAYRLTAAGKFDKVGPGGELHHAELGTETYNGKADTYGKLLAITRTDIINDDLGALTQTPMMLGRMGGLELNVVFWTVFGANTALFTSGHANYKTGVTVGTNDSRLNTEGLQRSEQAFLDQTDNDGNPVGIPPEILLVPTALKYTANSLMKSSEVRNTTASTKEGTANVYAGAYEVVPSAYVGSATYSGLATQWYMLANPQAMPVIELLLLNGQETPTIEQAEADFDTLGIQMRGYFDFGATLAEYRGGVKNKGAA